MTKTTLLKIARAYLLGLAIINLLTILVMLIMKDQTFLLRRPSSAAVLIGALIHYTDYKFWKNMLIAGAFSLGTGLLFLAIWPNGLALTVGGMLGLATALAGLAGVAHVLLTKQEQK